MNLERLKKLEKTSIKIISEIIFEETQDLFEEFGIITVTKIKISSDLSYLDVFVSSAKNENLLTKTLAKRNYLIQGTYNKKLGIRKLPKIRYRYDKAGKISDEILNTIKNFKKG